MKKLKQTQSENEVGRDVKNYLQLAGYKLFRINNGAIYRKKQDCYTFAGTPGVPDLIAINEKIGKLLFIELKKTEGKASESQLEFMKLIESVESVKGMVIDSLDNLLDKLK